MPSIRKWRTRLVENPKRFKDQNNNVLILTPDPGTIIEEGTPVDAVTMNSLEADLQLTGDIKGTIQVPTLASDDSIIKIEHKLISNNNVVRTDTFDYSIANVIKETRVLNTGETLIYKYHDDTLNTEVI